MVDRIEYCVTQTSDHIGQARGELVKAEEYKSKARKVTTSSELRDKVALITTGTFLPFFFN